MANTFSRNLQYNSSSASEKLERSLTIQIELINALKTHGCPDCQQLLREVIKKYGDSSLITANLPISNGDGPIDTSYRTDRF